MSDIPGIDAEGTDPDLNAGIAPTDIPEESEDDADTPDVLETPDGPPLDDGDDPDATDGRPLVS